MGCGVVERQLEMAQPTKNLPDVIRVTPQVRDAEGDGPLGLVGVNVQRRWVVRRRVVQRPQELGLQKLGYAQREGHQQDRNRVAK